MALGFKLEEIAYCEIVKDIASSLEFLFLFRHVLM
jgi:hypothetical protein